MMACLQKCLDCERNLKCGPLKRCQPCLEKHLHLLRKSWNSSLQKSKHQNEEQLEDNVEISSEDVRDQYSDAIDALFPPLGTEAHATYAEALEMVGNRHSKGALISLVYWLLRRIRRAENAKDAAETMNQKLRDEIERLRNGKVGNP